MRRESRLRQQNYSWDWKPGPRIQLICGRVSEPIRTGISILGRVRMRGDSGKSGLTWHSSGPGKRGGQQRKTGLIHNSTYGMRTGFDGAYDFKTADHMRGPRCDMSGLGHGQTTGSTFNVIRDTTKVIGLFTGSSNSAGVLRAWELKEERKSVTSAWTTLSTGGWDKTTAGTQTERRPRRVLRRTRHNSIWMSCRSGGTISRDLRTISGGIRRRNHAGIDVEHGYSPCSKSRSARGSQADWRPFHCVPKSQLTGWRPRLRWCRYQHRRPTHTR